MKQLYETPHIIQLEMPGFQCLTGSPLSTGEDLNSQTITDDNFWVSNP